MSTRSKRSTAQPLIFATLSRSKRGRALLLAGICTALLWTQASCRDVEADRGYCLVCAGTESDVGATVGIAGDGSGGAAQAAAVSGRGGAGTGTTVTAASSMSSSAAGSGGKSPSMTSTQAPAAGSGSVARAGAGAGAGDMSIAGASASSSGGRGGTSMSMGGSSSEPPIAGAASNEPCNGGCSGDQSVCDPVSNSCVQCTPADTHACPTSKRACGLLNHDCVECVDDSTCPSDKPVCDVAMQRCFECLSDRTGACSGDKPVCDAQRQCVECSQNDQTACGTRVCEVSQQKCVECTTADQCSTPDKPRCEQNACTGCASDGDCTRQQGAPVCDPSSKRCVQCTPDRGCTGGLTCEQSTHTCKDTGTHELALCKPCTNDGSCPIGAACVPYNDAKGRPAGSVCLSPKPTNLDCDSPPYTHKITVTSAGGTHGDFCAPPASCGTVDAFLTQMMCVAGAESCGDAMQRDGTCSKAGTCTYHCTRTNDCPSGATCTQDGECQHM